MSLPIGDLHKKIINSDENNRLYGHIPRMEPHGEKKWHLVTKSGS